MEIRDAQSHFAPDHCYLNTATVGLATRDAVRELTEDLRGWAGGRLDVYAYDALIDRARCAFANLVGSADPDNVAIISQLSQATSMVAASLRPGDEVLLAAEDFTSILFPLLSRERDGVNVRIVPLEHLVSEIRQSTTLVAASAVQSADGRVLDLDALSAATAGTDTLTFIDTTQAAGWLPIGADRFSVTAASAYKWLCCPRGSGLMTVQPRVLDRLRPNAPNWYSAEDVWLTNYGPPLRLASTARRFDLSPAWSAWVAAAPTLELLASVGTETIHSHNLGLANAFRARIDLEASNSAIVSFTSDGSDDQLASADISASARSGRTRLSFHLYNDASDVETVAASLGF